MYASVATYATYVYAGTLIASGSSFVLLALCSALHGMKKESVPLAKFALFLHTHAIILAVAMVDNEVWQVMNDRFFLLAISLPIMLCGPVCFCATYI